MGDFIMGNKSSYHNNKIGIINNYQQQANSSTPQDLNYNQVLDELKRLKDTLDKMTGNSDVINATENVMAAEIAAQQQNSHQLITHLKKSGAYLLNIARDIGVNVIADLISK